MILADTHAWVHFLSDSTRLSAPARQAVEQAAAHNHLAVCSVSVWEVCWLHERGRLTFNRPLDAWLSDCRNLPFLRFLPLDEEIAAAAAFLPPIHRDPIDRFILATAQVLDIPVVSADRHFPGYAGTRVIW